ncbi:MAG: protein kinase domain-containing protein [Steroidobacteraceae bacterium]
MRSTRRDCAPALETAMGLSIPQMALMSRLLDEALPLDADGRRRWLEALAPEYQPLAAALREALLPAESDGGLARLTGVGAPGDLGRIGSAPRPGESVGPYRLIRPLGEGGMAEVWLAQRADGAFRRDVALKLPTLVRLRKDLSSRFSRERDILAGLEHPHIARFYDAGVSSNGLPYLAMEYVAGEPVTTWCDSHRLAVRERLRLFLQVLDALQYAHSHRVIHRDIKPSNILVTATGQVRLLDFGIAKLLAPEDDQSDLTQLYGRALTPYYASPELLRGEQIGATVDIYALGVVLYELFCGNKPYGLNGATSLAQLERAITSLEVKRPSTHLAPGAASSRGTTERRLARRLRGDLDAIVLKALGKAPADRYESAAAFAEDCQRSLRGDPVDARPDWLGYRASKFVLRHRGVLATAAAAALVAGIFGYAVANLTPGLLALQRPRPPQHAGAAQVTAEPAALESSSGGARSSEGPLAVPAVSATTRASAGASAPIQALPNPRIAVLPFENLSPDPNNAFFTEGLHEEILTELANHGPGLDVISNTTMSTFRDKPIAVQTLARDLNCSYVLEGSVSREGNHVRLTLQLIDARSDRHLWAEDYDRKLMSAMALEREVAVVVAKQLSRRFLGPTEAGGLASDPQAYDLYLKARAAESSAFRAGSREELRSARRLLDQAIALDPKFARAYLERMSLLLQQFLNNYSPPDEVLPQAQADLAAAQRLAPADPAVTEFAGVMAYATEDYGRALQLFRAAEAAGLGDPELLNWKDNLLLAMGRYREAAALSARLADLDPRNESAQNWWIYMLMELHEYPEALRLADTFMVRDPHNTLWLDERDMVLGYAGGNFAPRHSELAPLLSKRWHTAEEFESAFQLKRIELNLQHRFADLRTLIDKAPVQDWRNTYNDWPLYRVGRMPLADERGWMDLMLGDRVQARRDGERIEAFLKRTPETKWNRWFRGMLRADAQLFMGDAEAAIRTAADAVALTRSRPDVSDQMDAYVWRVRLLAWSGRKEEAVRHLDGLSTSLPGLWPGEILTNPVYHIPLGQNAGYRALTARLARQMQALALK